MKNAVKTKFSIKDLEGLSGIKAHTIRIWEKRYGLLEPQRTDTNIRTYALSDLQKLLNVVFLTEHKYKISKIARHSTKEIAVLVASLISESNESSENHAINSFKIAMMNFDQNLFHKTYNALNETKPFVDIFYEVFIPLLHEIGLLWQTDTINPSHEHFIFNLIKHKILINIEKTQISVPPLKEKTFALFLPENEIHELGLLFLNYELVSHGYKVIYLGQSIMLSNLKYLSVNHPNLSFASYFTVNPLESEIPQYFEDFNAVFENQKLDLYVLGAMTSKIDESKIPSNIHIMLSIREFVNVIKQSTPSYA
ncbi:MerR family transcriptional regulator [Dokdonia sp. Dokd-P16]|uniref:MerR family transcriptional regulator n=1 Tax=Dokdonia sp. Dokd-P16 TaxID=2173169 RepID=UPI000D545F34|nr:MerR family transcriptional regulator [Dokdonia sp. Dokd-P16]AWH72992.1 MerR family transcriptional regulator [Dokdonia sp. Dokd-P16]